MAHTPNPEEPAERIVVRGGYRLHDAWPGETAPEVPPVRAAAEVGHVASVAALLAAVAGEDEPRAKQASAGDAAALRALTAHCEAGILQAALRVRGALTPVAVLAALRSELRRPAAPLIHRLAS